MGQEKQFQGKNHQNDRRDNNSQQARMNSIIAYQENASYQVNPTGL
mgnify:CR=1 FL=1